MHIQSETPTELVVVDGTLWMSVPFAIGFVIALYAVMHRLILHTAHRWDPLGPVILALFAWATAQHTRFSFDLLQRKIAWRRMKSLRFSAGSLPFDEMLDIAIETTITDKGGRVHRLTLITSQGSIPLSNGYSGIGNFETMRNRILIFVKGPQALSGIAPEEIPVPGIGTNVERGAETASSIRLLLEQGKKGDAIQLLRSSEGLDLAEAKQRVDAMEVERKSRQ